jgi:hypothetical protein
LLVGAFGEEVTVSGSMNYPAGTVAACGS